MIVTEAAAVGTPSIVFNTTGCCDAVNYGEAGYLCLSNTVEELYNKMLMCVENKDEYEQMRKRAYEFSNKFNWDKSAEEFEKSNGKSVL